jgi:hypothetical protein
MNRRINRAQTLIGAGALVCLLVPLMAAGSVGGPEDLRQRRAASRTSSRS